MLTACDGDDGTRRSGRGNAGRQATKYSGTSPTPAMDRSLESGRPAAVKASARDDVLWLRLHLVVQVDLPPLVRVDQYRKHSIGTTDLTVISIWHHSWVQTRFVRATLEPEGL